MIGSCKQLSSICIRLAQRKTAHSTGNGLPCISFHLPKRLQRPWQMAMHVHPGPIEASPSSGEDLKATVRKRLKSELRSCSADKLATESVAICNNVMSLPIYRSAKVVVAYLACEKLREVDTEQIVSDLLHTGKRVYVPVVEDRDSNMKMLHLDSLAAVREVPPFGIREPHSMYADGSSRAEIVYDGHMPDVVLVPGLGFDRSGKRLGRGGGYYDKFLEMLADTTVTKNLKKPVHVGLSFTKQLIHAVPVHDHDHEVDVVVTPEEVIWVADDVQSQRGT